MLVSDIFSLCVDLIDERLVTGAVNGANTNIYKARTPGILNLWQNEMCTDLLLPNPPTLTSINDTLTINYVSNGAYFLAAHLLLVEDASSANFFNQKFEETKTSILNHIPVSSVPIIDVYSDPNDPDYDTSDDFRYSSYE